jgi:hypothetical protein
MAAECSSERKSHTFFTLNEKLAIINLSDECMSAAIIGKKQGRPIMPNDKACYECKGKFSQEIKSVIPENIRIIKK